MPAVRPLAAPLPAPPSPRDDEAFLSEVRAFLDRALTPDLREASRRTIGAFTDVEFGRIWHRRLHAQGWIAPAWPKAWGGAGWDARQRYLWDRECALNDAPVLFAGGIRSLGPLLIEAGTAQQQAEHLPRMLSGEAIWCQGFSEPGAGSDLAALTTRAVRDGDDYLVTGAKIWTTGAHLSNWMFALVRTNDGGRKQAGLSFLLIDMASPGISVSPIVDIAGQHELNQVYFDAVRVPAANRVGEENEGWAVAKRLMQLARSNNTPAAVVRRSLNRVRRAVLSQAPADASARRRLAELEIALESFAVAELASLPDGRPDPSAGSVASMLKLIGTELNQKVSDLGLEVGCVGGAPHWAAGVLEDPQLEAARLFMAKHLAGRASTIYSGSSETQRNVIFRERLDG
jgi:acyl-CoA dehydrogenase